VRTSSGGRGNKSEEANSCSSRRWTRPGSLNQQRPSLHTVLRSGPDNSAPFENHIKVIAAREGGRLIESNMATRWGSFGFFGPLTVLPEYGDRGVAQRLLEATMTIFERWGLRHTGLFTFPQSAKHVGLYQKFGYWPRYLTAIMTAHRRLIQRHRSNGRMLQRCCRRSPKACANRPPGMRETHPQDR
jgi:GNAT superfamily N-acetyltransferase